MKPRSVATVNAALRAAGKVERLRRGNGYFYFTEGNALGWYTSSVPVCNVGDLTITQWLAALEQLREGSWI